MTKDRSAYQRKWLKANRGRKSHYNKLWMRRKRAGVTTRSYVKRSMKGWNNLFKAVRA